MYAWDNDAQRIEKMSSIKDPNQWVDYANFNPDKKLAPVEVESGRRVG